MADQGCVIDQIPGWAAEALSYPVTGETVDSTTQSPQCKRQGSWGEEALSQPPAASTQHCSLELELLAVPPACQGGGTAFRGELQGPAEDVALCWMWQGRGGALCWMWQGWG